MLQNPGEQRLDTMQEKEKMLVIFNFFIVFSLLEQKSLVIDKHATHIIMSSANASNLQKFKILSSAKGLMEG